MIEQVGQGRMRAGLEPTALSMRRTAGVLAVVIAPVLLALHVPVVRAQGGTGGRPRESTADQRQREANADQRQLEQTQREEGEAILALADLAMAGKPLPADFALRWQNDFVKAQRGTFVPFTLTVGAPGITRRTALVYVRATKRSPKLDAGDRKRPERPPARDETAYPVDAIFPVELIEVSGQASRVSRGFSVPPGEYDVYVVMRERVDPTAPRTRPKASVLRQPLTVPDFRTNELTTSSVIVADRMEVLAEPVSADRLAERPYVIGRNEITPAVDRRFGQDEELIVVFLVYNPMVTPERQFDVRVEYHFYRKVEVGAAVAVGTTPGAHPPARAGERYFNRTDPQHFNPALMGAAFDPGTGDPVMAGQVVPLAGFEVGEYRLDVQVIDLLSGKSVSRDVLFTVGSEP